MKGIASACVADPIVFATLSCVALCSSATAAENDEDLANKGLNPAASLISVPIRVDYDRDIGPREVGNKYQMTIQPVIPFSISTDWSLISRTLIPRVSQGSVAPGAGTQFGPGYMTLMGGVRCWAE